MCNIPMSYHSTIGQLHRNALGRVERKLFVPVAHNKRRRQVRVLRTFEQNVYNVREYF